MDASVAILDDWSPIGDPRLGIMPDLVRSAWEGSRAGNSGPGIAGVMRLAGESPAAEADSVCLEGIRGQPWEQSTCKAWR
jgi:hypothetical protein